MADDYDYDYFDDEGLSWPVWAGGAGALVIAALLLWFGIGALAAGDDDQNTDSDTPVPTAPVAASEAGAPNSDDSTTTTGDTSPETRTEPTASTTSSDAPPATAPGTEAASGSPSYETLADGSPVPVLAIFDDELIAISGVVPSESAAARVRVLALAYSATPNAQVASFLTVNPDVPVGVGVRVIETNSARFDEGSPSVSPEYIAQLDRVAAMMTSLPNVTVEVIGHADQRDDDDDNVELSVDRARASADYLISQGISPTRLSARGVGESDLLTLNNDDVALALNRRTEFVVYGLLVDPAEPS